jgi:hypothetical protein
LPSARVLCFEGSTCIVGDNVCARPRGSVEQVAIVGVDSTQFDGKTLLRLGPALLEVRRESRLEIVQHCGKQAFDRSRFPNDRIRWDGRGLTRLRDSSLALRGDFA